MERVSRGGAVGAGEDIFPDDLQNITTTTPPQGPGDAWAAGRAGGGPTKGEVGRGGST